jgi:hypothetical protein
MEYLLSSYCSGDTASSDRSFTLASDAWLLIVLPTAYFGQNAGLLDTTVKPFEQTLKTLVITRHYLGQITSASFQNNCIFLIYPIIKEGDHAQASTSQHTAPSHFSK